MTVNVTSKIIRIIGLISIIGGVISSLILGGIFTIKVGTYYTHEEYNWYIAIIGSVSSFVEGIIFLGFAEIINLLQANCDKQAEIIREIKNTENSLSKTIIVNNTPKQTTNGDSTSNNDTDLNNNKLSTETNNSTHTWRCAKCNKMISELPCPYCGDNFN